MGRNKSSQREIDIICKLLKRKIACNRGGQKMVRHILRTELNSTADLLVRICNPNALKIIVRSVTLKTDYNLKTDYKSVQVIQVKIRPSETFAMRQHIFSIHYIFMVVQ